MKRDIGTILLMHIRDRYEFQKDAAKDWGVTGAYISAVIRGKKRPSKRILAAIGYRCVAKTTYKYIAID